MTKKSKVGQLVLPNGVSPEPHELETVAALIAYGHDVTFIAPIRTEGQKTPDIEMLNLAWEMKTPMGNSKTTIFNAIKRGAKQSRYLVIDLRRTRISDDRALKDIRASMAKTTSIQRVMVINKDSSIIDVS